jgi:hypothetical protein
MVCNYERNGLKRVIEVEETIWRDGKIHTTENTRIRAIVKTALLTKAQRKRMDRKVLLIFENFSVES